MKTVCYSVTMRKEAKKDNPGIILAVFLILTGTFWALSEMGVHINLEKIFAPFTWLFTRLGRVIFSWPMIVLIAGLVLVSGKRQGGWVLVAIGGVFLIQKIFMFQILSFTMIFPLALVFTGIYMLRKHT